MKLSLAVMTTISLLAGMPAGVSAQPLMSTGVGTVGSIDPNWTFRFGTGSYGDAFVLNRAGGMSGSYNWIYGTATGSIPGGFPDQNKTRFSYSARSVFTGISSFSYKCAIDDEFATVGSVQINGAVVAGAGCDQYNMSNEFTVSNLAPGPNTVEFNWTGNGITDGVMIHVTSQTQVPEPATLGMVATGLVGMMGVARRRRRA
jgi:hypothetical protein